MGDESPKPPRSPMAPMTSCHVVAGLFNYNGRRYPRPGSPEGTASLSGEGVTYRPQFAAKPRVRVPFAARDQQETSAIHSTVYALLTHSFCNETLPLVSRRGRPLIKQLENNTASTVQNRAFLRSSSSLWAVGVEIRKVICTSTVQRTDGCVTVGRGCHGGCGRRCGGRRPGRLRGKKMWTRGLLRYEGIPGQGRE